MRDYRLSEIKDHDWRENWDVSDDISKGYREYEFLRELQLDLGIYDIEPRNMIELPCKIGDKLYFPRAGIEVEEYTVCMITIKADGKMKIRLSFYIDCLERKSTFEVDETLTWNGQKFCKTRAEADAFLAELKGGKQ